MNRLGRNLLMVVGFGMAVALGSAAGLAGDDPEVDTEKKGTVRIVVVDADGNRHDESFELDGDVSEEQMERLRERLDELDFDFDFDFDFDHDAFHEQMERFHEQLEGLDFDFDFDFDFEGFDHDAFHEQMERLHEQLEGLDFDFDIDDSGFRHSWVFTRHGRPKLGVELVEVTPELREHLGGPGDAGILVSRLIPGMPAEEAGVLVGDLIVAVDGETIEDAGDLRRALRDRDGESIDLEVIRDGRTTGLRVFIPEVEESEVRVPGGARPVIGPGRRT
jgi:C-terminal processing protease CtpA/Prc